MLIRPHFIRAVRVILNVIDARPSWGGAAVFVGLAGLFGLAVLLPATAWATHENDHRFTVSGYVRDKAGRPVKDARVLARDLGDQSVDPVTTYADNEGYYQVVLHLHDKNAGDAVLISAKDERAGFDEIKKIRAEFDPKDRHTERQAKVSFGPEPEKTSAGGLGGSVGTEDAPQYWVYGVGGVLVLAAIAAVAWSRQQQAKAAPKRRGKKR
jgi:hypothetical protein